MTIPATFQKDVDDLPPVLRKLLDAELAAGNEIDEIYHSFPAPPIGAVVKLKRRISTRKEGPGDGLRYRAVNSSLYSSEYTDEARRYFIIEPPLPPPEPIDMDAIREAHSGSSRVSVPATSVRPPPPANTAPETLVGRFLASMVIDYDKWHDGIGYDLELLKQASPQERREIEQHLLRRGTDDWRDVEALAALDTPAARKALKSATKEGSLDTKLAVLGQAPEVLTAKEQTSLILKAIPDAEPYGGLTRLLSLVEAHHPKAVIDALLQQLLQDTGKNAVHYAAMLCFLHGKASSSFDWEQRPFYLRFATKDKEERKAVFVELCEKIGVDPAPYLKRYKTL